MQEIAIKDSFCIELQELLDRYKNKMTTPQIMRLAQPIFRKTIGIEHSTHWKPGELDKFITEMNDKVYKNHCSSQEIAEASCDGDIRHCKNACHKFRGHDAVILMDELENPSKFPESIPKWIADQMNGVERAAFSKWYTKIQNEIEANKVGDTLCQDA